MGFALDSLHIHLADMKKDKAYNVSQKGKEGPMETCKVSGSET